MKLIEKYIGIIINQLVKNKNKSNYIINFFIVFSIV